MVFCRQRKGLIGFHYEGGIFDKKKYLTYLPIYTSKIVQKRREQVKLRASSADPPWATHQLNVPFLKLPLNQLFLERVSWTLFLRWLSFPWLGVPGPLEGEHWFTIYSIWSHLPILQSPVLKQTFQGRVNWSSDRAALSTLTAFRFLKKS